MGSVVVGRSLASVSYSIDFFSWGCSLSISSFGLVWITSSVSTSPIIGGYPSNANSLPLLNVTGFKCSLPSRLGFASEFLGSDPCCLSVNNVAIWPISLLGF